MSNVYDKLSSVRPKNMQKISDDEPSKSQKKAIDSLVSESSKVRDKSVEQLDGTQHFSSMVRAVSFLAGVNSMYNHALKKKFDKTSKELEKRQRELQEVQKGIGQGSISAAYREIKAQKAKKRFDEFQKRHPEFRRPQSVKENVKNILHSSVSNAQNALRTLAMRGMSESTNSDARALAAVEAAGWVPGSGSFGDNEMSL